MTQAAALHVWVSFTTERCDVTPQSDIEEILEHIRGELEYGCGAKYLAEELVMDDIITEDFAHRAAKLFREIGWDEVIRAGYGIRQFDFRLVYIVQFDSYGPDSDGEYELECDIKHVISEHDFMASMAERYKDLPKWEFFGGKNDEIQTNS